MPLQACTGALMRCTMGLAPASFQASPKTALVAGLPAGTVMDHVPFVNIVPFGLCRSIANPAVAAATSAAAGVLTPMPCAPATPSPWTPGAATVQMAGAPALADTDTLHCLWAGTISILSPGQALVSLP